jgi:hypothetical protein
MVDSSGHGEQPGGSATPRNKARWRPAQRAALATGAILLALLGFRWVHGVRADRAFLTCLDEARQADAAWHVPPVSDDENAAVTYRAAAAVAAFEIDNRRLTLNDLLAASRRNGRPRGTTRNEALALLEPNREALRLVRAARQRTQVFWGPENELEPSRALADDAARCRQLAELVNAAALLHWRCGESAEALATLRDLTHLLRMAGGMSLRWTGQQLEFRLIELVERIAPDLDSEAADEARTLIAALLEMDGAEADRRALLSLRRRQMEIIDVYCRGSGRLTVRPATAGASRLREQIEGFLCRPLWQSHGVRVFEHMAARLDACNADNAQDARAAWPPPFPERKTVLDRFTQIERGAIFRDQGDMPNDRFHLRATCLLAATRLALRLYELDHGQLPPNLDRLVPAYLPERPVDPYLADGAPIEYVPDGVELPLATLRFGDRLWFSAEKADAYIRTVVTTGAAPELAALRDFAPWGPPADVELTMITWLAARLYQAEHGIMPASLRPLLPDYLARYYITPVMRLPVFYDGAPARGWLCAGPVGPYVPFGGQLDCHPAAINLNAPPAVRAGASPENDPTARLVVVRLALQLHAASGAPMPRTLAELVPRYLPGVPRDPLVDDGAEVGYVPDGPLAGLYLGAGDAARRYGFAELDARILTAVGTPPEQAPQ